MPKIMFCLLMVITVLSGCSSEKRKLGAHSHPAQYSQPARVVHTEVKWHNSTYAVGETLTADKIGKEIGTADDSQSVNCVKCPPPPVHKGDKLYQIKDVEIQEAIAVKNSGGIYYRLNRRH